MNLSFSIGINMHRCVGVEFFMIARTIMRIDTDRKVRMSHQKLRINGDFITQLTRQIRQIFNLNRDILIANVQYDVLTGVDITFNRSANHSLARFGFGFIDRIVTSNRADGNFRMRRIVMWWGCGAA